MWMLKNICDDLQKNAQSYSDLFDGEGNLIVNIVSQTNY